MHLRLRIAALHQLLFQAYHRLINSQNAASIFSILFLILMTPAREEAIDGGIVQG